MNIVEDRQLSKFSVWMRTGRLPRAYVADPAAYKFNPWHDRETGHFTFAGGGGGAGFVGGGAGDSWAKPAPPARKPPDRDRVAPTVVVTTVGAKPRPAVPQPVAVPLRHIIANGYDFQIDSQGRTRQVSGPITVGDGSRSRAAQRRAGGSDRRPTDEGGHYIAKRFKGPAEAFNHFAQDANFNRGTYRVLEDQWASAKKDGKAVIVEITPKYDGLSQRPSRIEVSFSIDGRHRVRDIPNKRKGAGHGK